MKKPILILKIGTASISTDDGSLDEPVLVDIARQLALLHKQYRIVIVSSGAVGTGKRFLNAFSGRLIERKAAAAIGNPILINRYAQFFSPYKIVIAQSLCERQHFSNRKQFLQLRDTFETLWDNDIIPIANENDVVSNLELRFSDNDELASLIAIGFGASALLLGTSVPGVFNSENQLVPVIHEFTSDVLSWANKERSGPGLGGMISKLTFAQLATKMGIKVVIFGVREPNGIIQAVSEKTGTLCLPQKASLSARNKWLASGSLVSGRLAVDEGAFQALQNRKSLLVVGVKKVWTDFNAGEVFELVLENETEPFAVARAKVSSETIDSNRNKRNFEIAHTDDIVWL